MPARSIVLPNVTIGDNVVIGIGSIVNKDIPSGSLAAGSPCKVIKENYYPREVNIDKIVKNIIIEEEIEWKGKKITRERMIKKWKMIIRM